MVIHTLTPPVCRPPRLCRHRFRNCGLLAAVVLSTVMPSHVLAQAVPSPTINGGFAQPSNNLAGTTANSNTTGVLSGLGLNQGVTFTATGSLDPSGTGVWRNGMGFNSPTEMNVQARQTGLPNNPASYAFDFTDDVYGLQFTMDGLDNFDDTVVTFYRNNVPVAVPLSAVVAQGSNVNTSGSGGTILASGPGNNDGQEFFTVHVPLATAVDRVVFAPTGKSNGGGGNVTLQFRDFAWAVPNVGLTKGSSLDLGGNGIANAGDEITYTYTVTNNGRVPLTNVVLNETTFTGSGTAPTPAFSSGTGGATPSLLPVGETLTYTATYSLIAGDLGGSDIDNQATVTALPQGGTVGVDEITDLSDSTNAGDGGTAGDLDEDDVTTTPVPFTPTPLLTLTKVADDDSLRAAGETITYLYTVTNAGNVAINNVTVSDVHNGSGPAPVPTNETLLTDAAPLNDSTDAGANNSWDVLSPGDSVTFTGTYVVTQTDVDTLQ